MARPLEIDIVRSIEFRDHIENFISEGKLNQAVNQLRKVVTAQPELYREVILLSAAINDLDMEQRRGVVTREQYIVSKARLMERILAVAKQITDSTNFVTMPDSEALHPGAGPLEQPSTADLSSTVNRIDVGGVTVRQPSGAFPDLKRRTLEQRRVALVEEYQAANNQLDRILDNADRIRVGRQIKEIESRIKEIEDELSRLG
jgi:hypothetical protein